MTSLPDNTLLIWAHPWLSTDALEHVANHRLLKELRYPCTAPGHLAAQVFLGAATGELSWETALTGLHSRKGFEYPGQLNRYGHMQCPACQLSPTGVKCGQHDCGTPDCWRLVTDGGRIQWYSSQILNDVGGEASEADSPEWLRKLLLATGCPNLPGVDTEASRAAKGPLPSWQTPLFCLSSESGQLFRSIWAAFAQAWAAERAWNAHTFSTERAEAEAKDAFARREKFQLHFLLSHPSQPAPANGASLARSHAAFFDGKLQEASILSPRRDTGAVGSGSIAQAQPVSVKAEQDAAPMAAAAPAEAAGVDTDSGHLAVQADSGAQSPLPAQPVQSAPQQGPPSPAQALLRNLQQMQSRATRVSPEVIRAAIQLTSSSSCEIPAGSMAWAPHAAMQKSGGHVMSVPVTSQPARLAPAPQLAQPRAGGAPVAASPEVRHGCASAAPAMLRAGPPGGPARQSWLIPPRTATAPSAHAGQRPSAPVNLRMLRLRYVRAATAAAQGPRGGGPMMPAPQRAQPQSAFKAVAPASHAALLIRPFANRPRQGPTPAKSPLLPIRMGIGQNGLAIGVPVTGVDSRPVDIAAARVAHAECSIPKISNSDARRQLGGALARPLPDGSASAEHPVGGGQQGVHGMYPRTPSGQLGNPGGLRRPEQRPGARLSTVSSLSPPPASMRSLHDHIPGRIPHGDQAPRKRPLLGASGSVPKRQNYATSQGLQQPGNNYEPRISVIPAEPKLPTLPSSPPSPVPFVRKRARTWKLNDHSMHSAPRPKLSPGRPRVAHPDCTPPPDQAAGEASATSPSVQIIGDSPTQSPLGRKRGRPKGSRSSTSRSPVLLPGSPSEAGALMHFGAGGAADGASPGSPSPRKRGRPKGSRNAPVGVRLAADMARKTLAPHARPDLAGSPRPKKPTQEFGWLAHYARGGSGVDYNEAQLRKQKWSVASRVVKKAMRHRRAAVQARDSTACGDCTQTLLRMTPGQGMAPDGFAGFSMLELCKAVLAGGEDGAQASLRLAALTLEDIQARMAALESAQAAQAADVPKPVRAAQRLLQLECDRLAACLPSALARRASGAARTSRKPLSPSKIALLAPGVEQAHDPSEAAPIPLFSADPVIIDLDQEADDGQAEGKIASPERVSAMADGGQPHGTPPATPQQLRAAVDALTDQLDSAKKSLMTCVGSPAAQRQRDASLARCAAPAQALLAGQKLSVPTRARELPEYLKGAIAASATPVTLLAAAGDRTQDTSEASAMQRKPAMSAAYRAEHGKAEAYIRKAPAAAAAEQAPAEMPDLSAAMTLLEIGRGADAGCSSEAAAEEYAAYHAEPTAAPTLTAMNPRSEEEGLSMRETQQPSRPATLAPQLLAQAVESSHRPASETVGTDTLAPGISGSPEQHAGTAAADCPAKTGRDEGTAPEGGLTLPDKSSTAAAGAGEAAACIVQTMQRTLEAATLTERDISPDFGEGAQQGEGVQGRVMDTVGKLCRDIDPTQAHASNREQSLAAEAAKTGPQAAAVRAEADSSAKAGPRICVVEVVQHVKAAEAQRIEDSAHSSGGDPSQGGAAGGARKEGSKATEPQAADERSSGSAGSWKTCPETAEGLQPEKPADVPLTATAAPGKQRSADEAMTSAVPAVSGSANRATSAALGSGQHPATSATLGSGQHTSSRKSARAPSRVPARSARVQAEHSSGRKPSRMAHASPTQAQRGRAAGKAASPKALSSACTTSEGGSEINLGSPAAARTNVNTPLTSGCIFGPHKARKTAVWKNILSRA